MGAGGKVVAVFAVFALSLLAPCVRFVLPATCLLFLSSVPLCLVFILSSSRPVSSFDSSFPRQCGSCLQSLVPVMMISAIKVTICLRCTEIWREGGRSCLVDEC